MKSLTIKFCMLALVLTFPLAANAAETGQSMQHGQMIKDGAPQSDGSQAGIDMMSRHMNSRHYSDRMFLSAMIPHHEGAIVMAQEVLKNGKDPQVKKWANEVIDAQTSEIKDMQEWLKAMGGQEPESADRMNAAMRHMMSSPMDADPDRNFVEMMIKHHVGALEKATVSLEKSTDQNILKLSKAILETQAGEIYDYKQWLLKK